MDFNAFDLDYNNLITFCRCPQFVIRYDCIHDLFVFQHEEIKHGEPEYVTGEALALMMRKDVIDSDLNAWRHGISWEDIVA